MILHELAALLLVSCVHQPVSSVFSRQSSIISGTETVPVRHRRCYGVRDADYSDNPRVSHNYIVLGAIKKTTRESLLRRILQ